MRRPPPLSFSAVRANRCEQPATFAAVGGEGKIDFRGALSAGSPGWSLSALTSRRRNTIDLYVTARQAEPPAATGIEDYDYHAIIEVPPGLYHLRLRHVYLLPGARTNPPGFRVFERSVRVK